MDTSPPGGNPDSWRWAGLAVGLAIALCTGEAFFFLLAAVNALAHLAAGRALGLPVTLDVGWGPALIDRGTATGGGWRLRMLPGVFAWPGPSFRELALWRRLSFLAVGPVASATAGLALTWLALFAAALQPIHVPGPTPAVVEAHGGTPGDDPVPVTTVRPTRAEAARDATAELGRTARRVGAVLTGSVAVESLGGPVAIVSVERAGPIRAIAWLAGLAMLRATLLLTAFNLLPLPWSDGLAAAGEVAWSTTGRELPAWHLAAAGAAAVALLASLAFVNDIVRLLAG